MINLKGTVFIFVFFCFMKWHQKNFNKLRACRYYNTYYYNKNYLNEDNFSEFIILIENIDINKIRFKEKKELLKVLEYIFQKYRLYQIKSNYLCWFTFINKYCPFLISEREYIILEYILRLKEQLWWYYMKHYNIYHNIALNYIENCKRYLYFHKILRYDNERKVENIDPRFFTFPWDFKMNEKLRIENMYYKNIIK